ncbi:MAG: histone deacetylase [Candidatus Aenigmarchaeota archaeon]|nr:histone deacetylase [Candidatus Aenigmarchaeota archaeon]
MQVVYSPECLEYAIPGHPESPARVERIHDVLKENGFGFIGAEPAGKRDILLVHTPGHFELVKSKDYSGIETPPIDIKYPLLAAGVTIRAAERLGFALTRPPGHHAGRDSLEGFCYFNNIAIAVRKLGRRTAILDLDTHHGNGTQEIFMGDERVLYVSLHQSPLYPGTGLRSERNCHNFPLYPGTGEGTYLRTLEKALGMVGGFRPELLAVSMGFDTYKGDPLAGQQVTEQGFGKIGRMVGSLGLPAFVALEGGYSENIGELCLSFLRQL